MDFWTELVTWVFVTVNAGRIVSYLPQIVAAYRCRNGARAVSRATWAYFAAAHLTGVVYTWVVVHDPKLACVFLTNFLACLALVAIVSWKRREAQESRPGFSFAAVKRLFAQGSANPMSGLARR
jgi:hypothetical protein